MNRFILFICFIVLFENAAFSDCSPFYFRVWPEGKTLNRNPLIVLNFSEPDYPLFQNFKSVTPEIGKRISFSLKSDNSTIPLRLVQQNRGKTDEKQLVFKPDQLLEPNIEYELVFSCQDSILKKALLERIRFKSKTWTVNELLDKQVPVWTCAPQFLFRNYIHYGCGPESYWRFCMSFQDESQVFVQTIVRHLESGKISEFYLYPDSNSVIVGYHMCGGEFDMISGENYSVSFNLVDASGNSKNQFSDPIFVQAPGESDYLSDEELEKKKCNCDSDKSETEKAHLVSRGWILGIVALVLLIAITNWYRNSIKE